MDTIAAISTPLGEGAIGIVRISGEQALRLALRFFHSPRIASPDDVVPNELRLGTFFDGAIKEKCMMVFFKAPHSYTGEDMVEFQLHGGSFLVKKVLESLLVGGAKMASPGEFTKRAFYAGKLTLSEAEGVSRMIGAESEAELRGAYSLMSGRFEMQIDAQSEELTKVLSTMEAFLDYPEEMADEADDARARALSVRDKLKAILASFKEGKLVKGGVTVAIVGRTNVGKSSLLNAIVGHQRAIVTDVHGTTRDIVDETMIHKGVKLRILDTAGLRETQDLVENIGIERSLAAARGADVVLYVEEANRAPDEEELALIRGFSKKVILVNNKVDVLGVSEQGLNVSAKTGEGVVDLLDAVVRAALGDFRAEDALTEERHADCVRRALKALEEALSAWETANAECVLLDLRESIGALSEISGKGATERVINDVFSRFCVGK